MTDYTYLDTSGLVGWACGTSGSPEVRDQACAWNIEQLVEGKSLLVASSITLAEFSTVLHVLVRDTEGWRGSFDLEAADKVEAQLMRWLAEGELKVRNLGPKAFEMGMAYVVGASREQGGKMRAWDAIHLYEACRLSRELDQQISLATGDEDFSEFIGIFPEFGKHVLVLDVAAS